MNAPFPATTLLPLKAIERWTLWVLGGLTLARIVVAVAAPISPDESYYWLWTRPVQLSYFDHPGMVAWWIWCGVHILGDTAIGVRLPALISSLAVTAIVWDTARRVWSSREVAARAALWLNATLVFGAAGILMTPDAPLVLFWSLALWSICRLSAEGRARWLYVAGLAFGLGMISKYTMGLLVPGAILTFVAYPGLRRWFKSIHLWLALLLSLICTAPVVLWNARNDWASVAKQFGHAFSSGVDHPLENMVTFVGGQFGMATPIILVFVVWATAWIVVKAWRTGRADWFLLGVGSLPILIFFVVHALSNVVQAHWPGPAYLAGAIAAAGAPMVAGTQSPRRRRALIAAPVLGLVMTGLVYVQATTAVFPIVPRIDATKRLGGWDELAAAVAKAQSSHPGAFLLVAKHEYASLLSFYLPNHPVAYLLGGPVRPSFYDAAQVAALKGHDAIFVSAARDGDPKYLLEGFAAYKPLETVVTHWGGRVADEIQLTVAEAYRGGLITQGDGYPGRKDKP